MDITKSYVVSIQYSDFPTEGDSFIHRLAKAIVQNYNAVFDTALGLQEAQPIVYKFTTESNVTPMQVTNATQGAYYFPLFDADGSISNDLFLGIYGDNSQYRISLCTPVNHDDGVHLYIAKLTTQSSNFYVNYDMHYGAVNNPFFDYGYSVAPWAETTNLALLFFPMNGRGYIFAGAFGKINGIDARYKAPSQVYLIAKSSFNGIEGIKTSVLSIEMEASRATTGSLISFTPWKSHHPSVINPYKSSKEYGGLYNAEYYVIATNIMGASIVDSGIYLVYIPPYEMMSSNITELFVVNNYSGLDSPLVKDALKCDDEKYSIIPCVMPHDNTTQWLHTNTAFAIKQ